MKPMKRIALLLAVALLAACDSPTAPKPADYFPYRGCIMVQAGITKLPDGRLDDVWQQWHCDDSRNWQVGGDGKVFRLGTIFTASGKEY